MLNSATPLFCIKSREIASIVFVIFSIVQTAGKKRDFKSARAVSRDYTKILVIGFQKVIYSAYLNALKAQTLYGNFIQIMTSGIFIYRPLRVFNLCNFILL